eukprot:scaffold1731_cov175-Pinguiococcus_pyrenoidosus.AAC.1
MALVSGVDLRKDIFGKNKRSQISTIGKTLVGATEVTSSPGFDDLWTSAVQGFSSFFTAFAINDTGVMDKDVFTQALYEFHAERLLAQRKDPGQNPSFEGIRTAIARGLEGIYRYVTQDVGSIKALQASLALAQDQADILTDPERLAEYLESLQQSAQLIAPQTITVSPVFIKAEYKRYIDLYGMHLRDGRDTHIPQRLR